MNNVSARPKAFSSIRWDWRFVFAVFGKSAPGKGTSVTNPILLLGTLSRWTGTGYYYLVSRQNEISIFIPSDGTIHFPNPFLPPLWRFFASLASYIAVKSFHENKARKGYPNANSTSSYLANSRTFSKRWYWRSSVCVFFREPVRAASRKALLKAT